MVRQLMGKLPYSVLTELEKMKLPDDRWTMGRLRHFLWQILAREERIQRLQNLSSTPETRTTNLPHQQSPQHRGNEQRNWRTKCTLDAAFQVSHLRDVQQQRRQGPQPMQSSTPQKQPSTPCAFCFHKHYNDVCRTYKTMDERKNRIAQLKGCFLCLKLGHTSYSCTQPKRPCAHCQNFGIHNRSLCPQQFAPNGGNLGYYNSQNKSFSGNSQNGFLQTFVRNSYPGMYQQRVSVTPVIPSFPNEEFQYSQPFPSTKPHQTPPVQPQQNATVLQKMPSPVMQFQPQAHLQAQQHYHPQETQQNAFHQPKSFFVSENLLSFVNKGDKKEVLKDLTNNSIPEFILKDQLNHIASRSIMESSEHQPKELQKKDQHNHETLHSKSNELSGTTKNPHSSKWIELKESICSIQKEKYIISKSSDSLTKKKRNRHQQRDLYRLKPSLKNNQRHTMKQRLLKDRYHNHPMKSHRRDFRRFKSSKKYQRLPRKMESESRQCTDNSTKAKVLVDVAFVAKRVSIVKKKNENKSKRCFSRLNNFSKSFSKLQKKTWFRRTKRSELPKVKMRHNRKQYSKINRTCESRILSYRKPNVKMKIFTKRSRKSPADFKCLKEEGRAPKEPTESTASRNASSTTICRKKISMLWEEPWEGIDAPLPSLSLLSSRLPSAVYCAFFQFILFLLILLLIYNLVHGSDECFLFQTFPSLLMMIPDDRPLQDGFQKAYNDIPTNFEYPDTSNCIHIFSMAGTTIKKEANIQQKFECSS